MREAARIITGCTRSTPVHALLAEAGLTPVPDCRTNPSGALPGEGAGPPNRGSPSPGSRRRSVNKTSVSHRLATGGPGDVERGGHHGADRAGHAGACRRREAKIHLQSLPQEAIWVWTDGSATEGVLDGGAGALIVWPDGEEQEISAPAGGLCSSYRAELVALREAVGHLRDKPTHTTLPIVVCTDSQAALSALRSGPAEQRTQLNRAV